MANIAFGKTTGGAPGQGFLGDAFGLNDFLADPVILGKKKSVSFTEDASNYIQVKGKHFVYDSHGSPTGGTITSVVVVVGGVREISATGLANVSLADLYQAIAGGGPGNASTGAFLSALLAGNDVLTGTALDDHIVGGSNPGNDRLNGGAGADTMMGGAGDDTYVIDNAGDVADETGGGGIDTIESSITFSLSDGAHAKGAIENLTLLAGKASLIDQIYAIEHGTTPAAALNGTGNALGNILTGNAAPNVLTGLGGDDTLDGGAGADTMFGGSGNDTYVVDNVGDVVDETGGSGTDTIQSSISFSLSDAVHAKGAIENLTLSRTAAINGTGNAIANVITGNAGANVLEGLGGADSLIGGAGIDTASYAASPGGVSVSLATGLGSGGDAEGDTLAEIENLVGSSHDDLLEGTAGSNVLVGGAGIDTVSYAHSSDVRGVTVSLAVASAQITRGSGTDRLSGFENLTGSDFADTLTGDGGDNVLDGGFGPDWLNGGAGDDVLIAGGVLQRPPRDIIEALQAQGNDILTGGPGSDTFVFARPLSGLLSVAAIAVVTDFASGTDRLDLSEVLDDFGLGALSYDALIAGGNLVLQTGTFSAGTRTNDTTIADTGIYVSADGTSPGTLIATLEDVVPSADDFLV